jgi:glycosyltransferase involved in cell wall biosynthesis/peptidoglycan/xylan/chitin deacetylase (PgdA/CDA1 family)
MKSTIVQSVFSLLSPAGPGGRLSVLLFHKIPTVADPLTTGEMDLAGFERILDFIGKNANVMPLPAATAALQAGKLPKRAMALTFDDGYAEWIDNVSPALRKRNLPGTFFVTTGQLSGSALWHERIVAAVRALPDTGFSLPYGFASYNNLSLPGSRLRLVEELQERLKYAPLPDRVGAIEVLEQQARSVIDLPRPFDTESVRTLHNQGFDIGAHTVHHPILNECTRAQAREEIGASKEELEAIIGGRVHSFAYPNGRPNEDYGPEHVEMVRSLGYTSAVTTSNGVSTRHSDIFQLPRFTPWGLSDERIAFQLARNMRTRATPLTSPARAHVDVEDAVTDVRCLLIASTFPPIHGGSAVVYDNLCQFMPAGSVRVLTAKKNYLNHAAVEGWQEHDAAATYPIDRTDFLRPPVLPPPANVAVSAWRLVFKDFPLYAKALLAAIRIVRTHNINVVCIGELVAGSWLGIALAKLYKVKVIVYVHGEEITTVTGGRLSGNKRKDYLQAADKIVAVSSFTCDALTSLMDVKPESIVLIQNGVDTERFTPGPVNPVLFSKHNLAGKKVVVTVGRMVARKGVDNAVLAIGKLLRHRKDLHYLVVGDGELRPEVERMIAAEGIGEHITLVGKVSDSELVDYLRLSDLFLMPNRTMPDGDTEGFGLVFREANACGKPVIGGRAGGVVEAVQENESGLLVDGNNIDEIAAAIERVLDDAVLAEQLSTGGLQLALNNNTKAVARKFLKTCERLLSENQR